MNNEYLKNFAAELKQIREQKDITLQSIHNQTRIDLRFLQAIEDANFQIMPEVYIRAFIKEYAQNIGLDGDVTLKKYELAKNGKSEEEAESIEQTSEEKAANEIKKEFSAPLSNESRVPENKFNNSQILFFVYSALFIVAALIVYFAFFSSSEPEIIKETPIEEIINEKNDRFEVLQEEKTDSVIAIDSLLLTIKSIDTCWVGVTLDRTVNFDFIMYPNREKKIKAAKLFDVVVGNAAGVEFYLNNKKLNFTGPKNARRNIIIKANGISKGKF